MKILILPLVILIGIQSWAKSDTTTVGVFISSIYDLDYQENTFTVNYWLWRLNNKREFKEFYTFAPSNSKDDKQLFSSTNWADQSENQFPQKNGDTLFWDLENMQSLIKHDYDISRYPFDTEVLTIEFEGATYYDDWVKLKIDSSDSKVDSFEITGWKIGKMKIKRTDNIYASSFGSPGDTKAHRYSGFTVQIPIEREGWALFFKLFSGLFVSFVIALFSLRINIAEADGRFGVCVGALFASLANFYIVNSNLPVVSRFSFMDKAHILVIFLILVLFITSTFSLQFFKTKRHKQSKKLDKVIVYTAIGIFIAGMLAIWPY